MEDKTLPKLLVSREKAYQQIEAQIEKGKKLWEQPIDSAEQLEAVGLESENWSKYNVDLLTTLFENPESVNEYNNFYYNRYSFDEMEDICSLYSVNFLDYHLHECQTDMKTSISSLEGIRDRLKLFDEPDPPKPAFGDKIFIVHGRDEAAKHKIARFITDLDLSATILDEQPSKGQTIIDKFEEHADEAGFAIVLLTADDVGAPKNSPDELKPRSRQNVILELGYFLCGLGRDRVRILYEEDVELPSDIHGIIYVQMDKRGAWKLDLAQEIASVGITVDMNKLLPNR